MKTLAVVISATALIIAGLFGYQHIAIRSVHAQNGCNVSDLGGQYGYAFSGFISDNQGYFHFFSSSGLVVADGNGGLTGHDTVSTDGNVTRGRTWTGGYQVNSDCTGSLTFGNNSGSGSVDFVIVNGGNEIEFIQADTGANITGFAKRQ